MAGRKARRAGGRASVPNVPARAGGGGVGIIGNGPPPVVTGYWRADSDSIPLGSMGSASDTASTATQIAAKAQWGYWDQPGASVVDIATEGLPAAPWGGARAIRWYKPPGDSGVYQKLSKVFTPANWPAGQTVPDTTSPANVSGRYITYRYFRASDIHLNPGHGWLVLMTFKENYHDGGGAFHQDGTGWKVAGNNFDAAYLQFKMTDKVKWDILDYTDRWVKWEYRLYQGSDDTTGHGGRVELWADDVFIDVGYEGDLVEGAPAPTGHVGSAAAVPLSQTEGWIFPVGQYTSNQVTGGVGDWVNTEMTSFVGLSCLLPIGSSPATLGTENWNGTDGSTWPGQWTTATNGGTITRQSNRGRMTVPAGSVPGPTALLSGMTDTADTDARLSFICPSSGGLSVALLGRVDSFIASSDRPTNGYALVLDVNGSVLLRKTVAGSSTTIGSSVSLGWPGPGVIAKMRLQCQGTAIRGKVWDGSGSEPAAWTFDLVDSSVTTGKLGLSSFGGVNTALWDELTVVAV